MNAARASIQRAARPRRVQLVGYYGMGNFGDDLFVDTLLHHAPTLWPRSNVATFTPEQNASYASTGLPGQLFRLTAMGAAALWADTFAFGGGSILQDVSGITSLRNRIAPSKRREAYGVSIGPFAHIADERRVAAMLEEFDRVIVRDASSVEQYQRILPERSASAMGGDLAGLSPRLAQRKPNRNVVTVCPSAAAAVDVDTLADQVSLAIEALPPAEISPSVQVLALSAHPVHGDEDISISLSLELGRRGLLSSVHFYSQLGLEQTCTMLASSGAVWSQRLHGAIVAYLCNVPFLLVGHHAKCHDFAHDIGLVDRCIIAPDSSWSEAARLTLSGQRLWRMEPVQYRDRAERVYFA